MLWESDGVLAVPWSALVRRGEGWGVFAIGEGRATWRDVEIGHRGARAAEIRKGLAVGDSVVVHPGADVEDGVRVTAR